MTTHDYILNDANGVNFRADINSVLAAIVSNNSNATEPTTMYAYMLWADTTSGILKQRDSSNLSWVEIWNLATGGVISIDDLTDAIYDNVVDNMAFGDNALTNNTTGTKNVAITSYALTNNTTGSENTAIGSYALSSNTTGSASTAVGALALTNSTTGTINTAVGNGALWLNTTGNENTAVGALPLAYNTTGSYNTAIGTEALKGNTTGIGNTAVGNGALFSNTTGVRNIAIGDQASKFSNLSDTITIGASIEPIGANYFTFGSIFNRVFNQFTTNATWTRNSDKRVKKEIATNEDCGLDFINDLRTVTYKWKAPSELAETLEGYDADIKAHSHTKKMYGFIAQEVKKALDKHNITDFAGHHQIDDGKDNMQGISYEMFVMPLVKGMQELSAKIDEQAGLIADLTTRLKALEDN